MNTITKKVLAVTLVCTVPLGLFAYDKYERHGKYQDDDRGDHKKSSYKHHGKKHNDHKGFRDHDDFDDLELSYEMIEKLGINLVFEGDIEKRPSKGLNGVWVIAGKEVLVDDTTKIFMEDNLKVSQEVAVLAKREKGKIKAIIIEED